MSKQTRDERTSARRRQRRRGHGTARPLSPAQELAAPTQAIFEPLENRRLLSTTSFENLAVGSLGSNGYVLSIAGEF